MVTKRKRVLIYCEISLEMCLKFQVTRCQRLGGGDNGSDCLMGIKFQFCEMKGVLEMDGGDGCKTL